MTTNPKRVSFGSHGSMVETLIIDVDYDSVPAEERKFYEDNRLIRTSASSLSATSTGCSPRYETVSHDNPFQADGELRRKADQILARSRISRSDLHIVDPDNPSPVSDDGEVNGEVTVCRAASAVELTCSNGPTAVTSVDDRPPAVPAGGADGAPPTDADVRRPEAVRVETVINGVESGSDPDGCVSHTVTVACREGRVELSPAPGQLQRAMAVRVTSGRRRTCCVVT